MELSQNQKSFECLSHEITEKKIFAYGSPKPLQLAGKFCVNIEGNGIKLQNIAFVVLERKGRSLLSKNTAIKLDVLQTGPNVFQVNTNIEKEYSIFFHRCR